MEPQIIIGGNEGFHNDSPQTAERIKKGRQYEDLSTVCVIPSKGTIPARAVESWMGLASPMNNAFVRMFITGMEVGEAYNAAIETILGHPQLQNFKYVLTLEEDNLPPYDGLLKLQESIKDFDAVGGLYWTKGPGGQPMIYGNAKETLNFRPQEPLAETVQECHGLGMGFTLFRLDLFRELEKPWFRTLNAEGGKTYTQDLYFFENARKAGKRVACDTRVRVGHLDNSTGVVW